MNSKIIKSFCLLFKIFVVIVALNQLPHIASNLFPHTFGHLEGLLDTDLTGAGRCRIDNPKETLKSGGSKLRIGWIKRQGKADEAHVWGLDPRGETVDLSCPMTDPQCRNRAVFAEAKIKNGRVYIESLSVLNHEEQKIIKKNIPQLQGIMDSQL